MIYKMSKKIAQLTKVVYYLNSKNEDAVLEVERLERQHASEIEKVFIRNIIILNGDEM